jgi:glycosyltransferase involved in cell wall biosynthesis
MRLLFVTPAVPYPPLSGSALIALNQIRRLASRHTVDLISFKNRKNPSELGDLPSWCNDIKLIDRSPRWRVLIKMLSHASRDPHPVISGFSSAEMTRTVNRRLASVTYDVVLFQLLQTAQFLPSWYQSPTIWCLEDPPALKSQRVLPLYPWYKRPLVRSWIARLKRYETCQASRFDRVVFVNEEDSLDDKNLLNATEVDWVPSGIDVDRFRPSCEISRREGMIVLTGNMYHVPNVDAVEYFCRNIFPLICERVPSATLWLVGDGPVRRVRKWARDSRIKITGFVPDIRPYLQEAMVSVCPVRLKIGTQTKVLEALACGTPVVTSPAGNHGIGAVSGEHLYVARHPVAFAEKVIGLLRGEEWSAVSTKGRRFVEDNFTWEKSVEKLEQILERLAPTTKPNLAPR